MSRDDWTLVSLLVHVPFVTAWVGLVMFDAFAAMTPGLSPEQRGRVIARTRWVAVAAIAVIMVTGIWQTMDNPFVKVDSWATLERLRTKTYGEALFFKHMFIFGTIGLTFLTRFILAPRLIVAGAESDAAAVARVDGLQRSIMWASILNLAACFGALILAARMAIELH